MLWIPLFLFRTLPKLIVPLLGKGHHTNRKFISLNLTNVGKLAYFSQAIFRHIHVYRVYFSINNGSIGIIKSIFRKHAFTNFEIFKSFCLQNGTSRYLMGKTSKGVPLHTRKTLHMHSFIEFRRRYYQWINIEIRILVVYLCNEWYFKMLE